MKARTPLFGIACACLTNFTMSLSASAANGTWTGGGNNTNWSNAVNWSDGIAAGGASASATFSGNGSNSILLDTSVTLGSLNFSGTSANTTWTLSPSGSPSPVITLARSGQTPSINVGADVSAEISVALGGIYQVLGISYGGLFTKTGSGTLTLTGANFNGGTITIADGAVAVAGGGSIYWHSNVDLTGSSTTLDISEATASSQNIRSLSGVSGSNVELGSKTLTLGAVPPGNARPYWFNSHTAGNYSGNITGDGGALVKTIYRMNSYQWDNRDVQVLSGTNTYTGNTTILGGTLQFAKQSGSSSSMHDDFEHF